MRVNKVQHFIRCRNDYRRQLLQPFEYRVTIPESTQCDFTHDEWVNVDGILLKKANHLRITMPKEINPN